ncbi:PLP-dependent transferase [Aspergillus falconensis]
MGLTSPASSRAYKIFSKRGQTALDLGSKRITWDIISDMWHPLKNPSGYLSVRMAENTLLHTEHLSYNNGSMGPNTLRKAVSHFLNRHFDPFRPVEPAHVPITNGCSSAIEHLSWTFLNPGEAILLSKPYYSTFIADICLRPEAVLVPVEMGGVDSLSLEACVRAVMLCNLHNPLRRCYPRRTVDRLMRLCQTRQIHLIADEIYVLSVWENRVDKDVPFAPFESLVKAFCANGLRVGALISQGNPELHIAQKCLSLYSFVSGLSDQITASILENDGFTDQYIQVNREKLSTRGLLVNLLNKHGIEYSRGCHAGFLSHPRVDVQGLEFTDLLFQLLLDNKVYVTHGTACFAHPLPWLEAMLRILRTIQ